MRKSCLEGVNCLKTAHLVGSRAQIYGLTFYAVENYIIVTKSMMPIAHTCQQIHINSSLISSFDPDRQARTRNAGLENVGLGARHHNLI
jgi:hypothetical protein